MSLECETVKEQLVDKFYGDIEPASLRQLEHHVAACLACQEEERRLRMDLAGLPQVQVTDVARTLPDFLGTVRPRIASRAEGWWSRFGATPIPAYQVGALVVILVAGWTAGVWAAAHVLGRGTPVVVRERPFMQRGYAVFPGSMVPSDSSGEEHRDAY